MDLGCETRRKTRSRQPETALKGEGASYASRTACTSSTAQPAMPPGRGGAPQPQGRSPGWRISTIDGGNREARGVSVRYRYEVGPLEAADQEGFAVRNRRGELVAIPRERALAAKVIPPR